MNPPVYRPVRIGALSTDTSGENGEKKVPDRLDELVEKLSNELGRDNVSVEHKLVREHTSDNPTFMHLVEYYKPYLKELVEEKKVDVLFVNGGDGTMQIVISALVELYRDTPKMIPKIRPGRGGTQNISADSLDVPRKSLLDGLLGKTSPEIALDDLVRKCSGMYIDDMDEGVNDLDRCVERYHVLKVEDGNDIKYGVTFANGMLCNYLERYYGGKWKPSNWKAAAMIGAGAASAVGSAGFGLVQKASNYFGWRGVAKLSHLWKQKAGRYANNLLREHDIDIYSGSLEEENSMGMVCTAFDTVLKLPFMKAKIGEGMKERYNNPLYKGFYSIGATGLSKLGLLSKFIGKLRGKNVAGDEHPRFGGDNPGHIFEIYSDSVSVVSNSGANVVYTLDGDMYKSKGDSVRISSSDVSIPFLRI